MNFRKLVPFPGMLIIACMFAGFAYPYATGSFVGSPEARGPGAPGSAFALFAGICLGVAVLDKTHRNSWVDALKIGMGILVSLSAYVITAYVSGGISTAFGGGISR
jgi:hypothetical protein